MCISLQMSGNKDVSAFPDGDNLFSWIGTIKAADGTVYEGASYKLSLKFPQDYPFSAPTVKFETECFHPNVDQHGNICLDILKEEWSAIYNVQTILLSIQSLLGGEKFVLFLNSCFLISIRKSQIMRAH